MKRVSTAGARNPQHSTHNFRGPWRRLRLHSQPRSWVLCGQTHKHRCSQEQLAKREERSGSKRSPAPDRSGVFPLPRGRSLHSCLQTQPREPLLETPPYPSPSVLPLLGRVSEWVWGKEKRGSVSHRGCRASLHHTQHGTKGQEPEAIPSGSRRPSHQGRYVPVTLMETLQLEKKQQC